MQDVRLITVDVWDTLLRRNCHPDEVKLHTARHLLLTSFHELKEEFRTATQLYLARRAAEDQISGGRTREGLDDEYRLPEVYALWLRNVLSSGVAPAGAVEELLASELRQEMRVGYRDPSILGVLSGLPAAKRVFVSDFYMGAQDLQALLRHFGVGEVVPEGYSSCDLLLNKRSGRIFQHVIRQEQVTASQILHIGDNPHSDVGSPRRHGITAIPYLPEEEHRKRLQLVEEHGQPELKLTRLLANVERELASRHQHSGNLPMLRLGVRNAPLIVGFVLRAMEGALRNGHDTLFFLTREGEFFKQVYDALARHDPFGLPVPKAVILEVSRVATFGPSLGEVSTNTLMRIWGFYSTQSLAALFRSLDVDSAPFEPLLRRHSLNPSEEIESPWLDPRIGALVADADFQRRLTGLLGAKREALRGYLEAKGFPSSGKAALVDIGWRGTIQDNLAHLLPEVTIDGFYLGIDHFINRQPANARKHGYIADLNQATIPQAHLFQCVSPLEMLCNSGGGSVTGYTRHVGGEGDSGYTAVTAVNPSEQRAFNEAVAFFQQGVVESVPSLAEAIRLHGLTSDDLRGIATGCWDELIRQPPAPITQAYFRLAHNESFGRGGFEDKSAVIPLRVWFGALVSIRGAKLLIRRLEQTGWPEGYLARRKLLWLWSALQGARRLAQRIRRLRRAVR
jgi:FMN phosphatase YigB (HAD superfamily)